ncbi:hypothetical protein BMR09_03515, partial [Methylococcaceae bacterium CS3]
LLFAVQALANDCSEEDAKYDMQQGRLSLHSVSVGQQGLLFEAQLDLLNSQNLFQFQLTSLNPLAKVTAQVHSSYKVGEALLKIDSLCLVSATGVQYLKQVELQLVANSEPL